jgi:hypothetical protein
MRETHQNDVVVLDCGQELGGPPCTGSGEEARAGAPVSSSRELGVELGGPPCTGSWGKGPCRSAGEFFEGAGSREYWTGIFLLPQTWHVPNLPRHGAARNKKEQCMNEHYRAGGD